MPHLARVATLGVVALSLAVPGTATAAQAKRKPKHTVTVNTVDALPKTTSKNLNRKCGKSKSATKIRKRSTSRPTKNRVRTVTTYCSGGTRTQLWIKKVTKTITVPGPVVTVPAAPAPAPAPAPKGFRLTLLHNNDGESKYGVGDSIGGYGGVTRFKTVLDRLRGEADAYNSADLRAGRLDKGTVTVSSGDNILAGLNLKASFTRFDAGQGPFYDSVALDRIGYDAITIGNHEYDFGPARLQQLIEGTTSGVPFLSANTDFSAEPGLQALRAGGRIADSAVVYKGGQPIGIIGVTTPDVPSISSPGNVKFLSDVAGIVNAEAARLQAAGVNKIIMSSHLQNVDAEVALIKQLRHVDIVISGGGDELLANVPGDLIVPTSPASVVKGPYPLQARDADEREVPVVTTQGEYRYVGRLTVEFDGAGNLIKTDKDRSGPVRVSATTTTPDYVADEDPALKSGIIAPLDDFKAVLAANVIGTTEVPLQGGNPNPIRVKESNLGNLVADSFLAAANRTAAADGRPVANVAFSNGGGIRTSIAGPAAGSPTANISEKQTFDVLPFDNLIATVPSVTPQKFKDLMEWGVAARSTDESVGNGKFPQISGFKLVVSGISNAGTAQTQTGTTITKPGTRVQSITLDDGTKIVENGNVVAGAPNVNIATTNFTASNGDAYPFNLPFQVTRTAYQQSLFDYIRTELGGAVTAARYPVGGSGRITINP